MGRGREEGGNEGAWPLSPMKPGISQLLAYEAGRVVVRGVMGVPRGGWGGRGESAVGRGSERREGLVGLVSRGVPGGAPALGGDLGGGGAGCTVVCVGPLMELLLRGGGRGLMRGGWVLEAGPGGGVRAQVGGVRRGRRVGLNMELEDRAGMLALLKDALPQLDCAMRQIALEGRPPSQEGIVIFKRSSLRTQLHCLLQLAHLVVPPKDVNSHPALAPPHLGGVGDRWQEVKREGAVV